MVPRRSLYTLVTATMCAVPYSIHCMNERTQANRKRLRPETITTARILLHTSNAVKRTRVQHTPDTIRSTPIDLTLTNSDPSLHQPTRLIPKSIRPTPIDTISLEQTNEEDDALVPMFSSPSGSIVRKITSMIDTFSQRAAQPELLIDMYIFTNEEIFYALERAQEQRPDMRISINIMKGYPRNQPMLERLSESGFDVCATPSNHEKRFILHDKKTGESTVIVGSLNASWTGPRFNKEGILPIHINRNSPLDQQLYCLQQRIDHERIRRSANSITEGEIGLTAYFSRTPNAEPSLVELLQAGMPQKKSRTHSPLAYTSAHIGTMTFDDQELAHTLMELKKNNVDVQLICDRSALSKKDLLQHLSTSGIDLRIYNPYGTQRCESARHIPKLYHLKNILLRKANGDVTTIVDTGNLTRMGKEQYNVQTRIENDVTCYQCYLAKFRKDQLKCVPFERIRWERVEKKS